MQFPKVVAPFQMDANATVFFQIPTGEYKTEKVTRNKIALTTEASIKAWITELGEKFTGQENSGSNLTERRVRGYFLVPKLPVGLRGSDRVRTILTTTNGTEEVLLFFSERATPLKGVIIQSLGIPFEGHIQSIGGAI